MRKKRWLLWPDGKYYQAKELRVIIPKGVTTHETTYQKTDEVDGHTLIESLRKEGRFLLPMVELPNGLLWPSIS